MDPDNRGRINTALSDMEDVMTEKLLAGGAVSFSPKGKSMLPMLRSEGDRVTLKKPPARLKKGTVALFVSTGDGERRFVLHRLVKVKDGLYTFCGDNRRECDAPGPYENVIGVVTEYESRGRKRGVNEAWYRLYSFWMTSTYGIRGASMKAERLIYGVWRKLFRRKK